MPSVEELVLIAAPSCCGKTRFLAQAFDGRHDELLGLMGVSTPLRSYAVVTDLKDLAVHRDARLSRMILHFTIPSIPLIEGRLERIADDRRLDFVKTSKKVTAITLLASDSVLACRLQLRYRATRKLICKSVRKYFKVRRKLDKLQRIYAEPANLVTLYEAWFRYTRTLPNLQASWLVEAEDDYELHEATEWQQIRDSYFPASPALVLSH